MMQFQEDEVGEGGAWVSGLSVGGYNELLSLGGLGFRRDSESHRKQKKVSDGACGPAPRAVTSTASYVSADLRATSMAPLLARYLGVSEKGLTVCPPDGKRQRC